MNKMDRTIIREIQAEIHLLKVSLQTLADEERSRWCHMFDSEANAEIKDDLDRSASNLEGAVQSLENAIDALEDT